MKTLLVGLSTAALIAVAVPAEAQQKGFGFGFHGSWLSSGELAEGEPLDTDLKLDDGWTIGGGMEGWFGSRRWGLRLDAAYTSRPWAVLFEGDEDLEVNPLDDEIIDDLNEFGDVDTWMADASLMMRILTPRVDRTFAPYLSLGTGLIYWDHKGENVDLALPAVDALILGEDQTEMALTGAIGADLFLNETVALRLEAKDYWNSDSPYLVLSDQERDHEGGHNVMWTAGLQFNFGGKRVEEPGFVAAPPPPPPPPPAPPATERVTMCVVDPAGRLTPVQATRMIESGQIYVARNGQEVAFSTVYTGEAPTYIRSAPWYVANRPLVLDLADERVDLSTTDSEPRPGTVTEDRIEFVNFGPRAPIAPKDLMYVGSVDGTPVFAKVTDVGALRPSLEERLRGETDLEDVLEEDVLADRFANEIETLYLAVEPGRECVFQPMSSTRVVRRTKG